MDSVRSICYHHVLRYHDAGARLEGREGAYLFWESDVKAVMFIISYVKSCSVAHILDSKNQNDGKFFMREVVDIDADIIAPPSESFKYPIPQPRPSHSEVKGRMSPVPVIWWGQ